MQCQRRMEKYSYILSSLPLISSVYSQKTCVGFDQLLAERKKVAEPLLSTADPG